MTAVIVIVCLLVGYLAMGTLTAYICGKHGETWMDAIDGFALWPIVLPWMIARMAFEAGRRKR